MYSSVARINPVKTKVRILKVETMVFDRQQVNTLSKEIEEFRTIVNLKNSVRIGIGGTRC